MISVRSEQGASAKGGSSDWLTPGCFAGLLGLLLLACFPAVILGLRAFAYGDAGQFAYPVAFYHRESVWRGEIPLWNPLNNCGVPFLAQWNTLVLYPLSLFYVLLPVPCSFGVFCLGHLLLGGVGMYLLARRYVGNRLAAAVAGTAFAFNGLTWYGIMWPHIIAALAWMPWTVLAMERAWHKGGRMIVLAAMAAAMQLLSGGVEVVLQTWIVLGVFWLANLSQGEMASASVQPGARSGAGLGARQDSCCPIWEAPASRWKLTARFLAAGILAGGLAAAQLLPFLDLLAHSQRSSTYSSGGIGNIAPMPLTGWLNYLVPLLHCVRTPQGVWVQAGQSWTASYYLGTGLVALALLAVWKCRLRGVRLLAGLTLFGLLMALGKRGLVYEALKHVIPLLGFIRFQIKFVVLVTFAVPLLAAAGLSWLQSLPPESKKSCRKQVWGLVVALMTVMAGSFLYAWLCPQQGQSLGMFAAHVVIRMLFLAVLFATLVRLSEEPKLRRQRLLQTSLILLVWFDVFTHSSNLSPTVAAATLEPDAIRRYFSWDHQLDPGAHRAMLSKRVFWKMLSEGLPDMDMDVNGRRLSLFEDLNLLDHAAKFNGSYSLDIKEYLDVFARAYFTSNNTSGLQDFLGVSLISNPTNVVDWVGRDSCLPLITTSQRPVFASPEATLEAVLSDRFEPGREVYLPTEAQHSIRATGAATARILSSHFSAQRIQTEVDADAPAMVVVAQTFYHPWHAYVDGVPTRLYRANYAFQAFEVPPGKHRVVLAYEDQAFVWGLVISLSSIALCATPWLKRLRAR